MTVVVYHTYPCLTHSCIHLPANRGCSMQSPCLSLSNQCCDAISVSGMPVIKSCSAWCAHMFLHGDLPIFRNSWLPIDPCCILYNCITMNRYLSDLLILQRDKVCHAWDTASPVKTHCWETTESNLWRLLIAEIRLATCHRASLKNWKQRLWLTRNISASAMWGASLDVRPPPLHGLDGCIASWAFVTCFILGAWS